jgi:hypothetical protein
MRYSCLRPLAYGAGGTAPEQTRVHERQRGGEVTMPRRVFSPTRLRPAYLNVVRCRPFGHEVALVSLPDRDCHVEQRRSGRMACSVCNIAVRHSAFM